MSHCRKVCSCGAVISCCRCPGEHPTKTVPFGCGRCAQYRRKAGGWRYDPAEMAHVHPDGRRIEDVDLARSSRLRNDFRPCPDCGRRKVDHLTQDEAVKIHGFASSDCFTCRLTLQRRSDPMPPMACPLI